ncbi:hypothetical protein C2S51_031268 [Perilla frutescens var. frutescens]|nr:hypothetical protein C2S51_031268 [Perilla frutescens var. frutescens]
MTPREADFGAKHESINNNGDDDTTKMIKASSTTTTAAAAATSWSRLKDPRIVRVSRAMGGKDRHSKVCTVRGLRDRRVRLSVPTAIQLYDLQERLGLNQPSKVVDWLLNAAQNEIDQLPPLQIPQGMITFTQMINPDKQTDDDHNQSWTRTTGEEDQRQNINDHFNNFLSRSQNHVMSNNYMTSFGRWDPSSNLSLSHHTPISLGLTAHHQDFHNLYNHQSGMITQPYFTPQINADHASDSSSINAAAVIRPIFDFNMSAAADGDEQNKRDDHLHSS